MTLTLVFSNVHEVLKIIKDEWKTPDKDAVANWDINTEIIEQTAYALHVPDFEVSCLLLHPGPDEISHHKMVEPSRLNWEDDMKAAKLCDQIHWLSSLFTAIDTLRADASGPMQVSFMTLPSNAN